MKKPFLQSRVWQAIQVVAVVVLFAAMWWFKGDEFAKAIRDFDLKYLLLAFAVYFVSLLLTLLRWQLLVRTLGLPFTMFDAFRLGFLGAVTSLFMPGSITGDLVKASFLASEQSRRAAAVATILVDRVLGLYALLLLTSLIGLVFFSEVQTIQELTLVVYFVWAVTGGAAFAVLLTFLFKAEPFIAWLERVRFVGRPAAELVRALQCYKHSPGPVAAALGLGMIGHVGFVLTFQFCALAVTDTPPSWELQYLVVPVYMVATVVPLTPMGNIGAGEAMLGGLFQMIGAPFVLGASVALAQRVVTWAAAAVGLIWYIPLHRDLKRRQAQAASELIHEFEDPPAPQAEPSAQPEEKTP